MTPAQVVAANMRLMLRARGWSQRELSNRSGVGQPGISRIASGDRFPAPSTLWKLAKAFEVHYSEFSKPIDCGNCKGEPPRGFTCMACGSHGAPPAVTL